MASYALVVLLLSSCGMAPVLGQGANVFCLLRHCASEMMSCMLDSSCREAVLCIQPCGSNQTCAFMCLNSYADPTFDAFLKCAVTDNRCVQITPPDHPVQCRKPLAVLSNFTLANLQGTWYIVKGLNPVYDCFNCQISTYTIDSQPHSAHVQERFDALTVSGMVRHLVTNEKVVQRNPQNGGVLNYNSTENGLYHESEFSVLAYSIDFGYIFMYYCGSTGSWKYEGALVYSRTPALTSSALRQVTLAAAAHGYNLTTFCSPQTTDCSSK